MKNSIIFQIAVFGLAIFVAHGAIPQAITYQGWLTDDTGSPVADGNYSLTFKIYDAASGGTSLWSETHPSVAVAGGLFKVQLGSVTPITPAFDAPYWLEVQVGSGSPQTPRIELSTVPYSFMAMDADHVDGFDASATPTANTLLPLDATGKFPESAIPSVPAGGTAGGDLTGTYPNPTIAANAVNSAKIQDGQVRTADIQNDAVTVAKIAPNIVSSVDGVNNDGGDIDLVAGANVTITPNDGANTITIAASGGTGGDITGVGAGQGLTGGGTSGDVSLDVGAGTGIAVSTDAVGLTSAYANGGAYDSRFVNEGQSNSVTSDMIVDGTIQQGDLGFSAGDVTAVWSGEGLDGGGDQGDLTLAVANPLELTGSSNGVIQGTHTDGNYGLLGDGARGVLGHGASGNWGYLGGESARGAYGWHANGHSGGLGTANYGVEGKNTNGNWGTLGNNNNGAYGEYAANGNYGYLGSVSQGATGVNDNGKYGALGRASYGVYYSGGLGGTGTKSCIVKTSQGPTALYCQESPEAWFEDFGEGALVNGRAHIELDPLFLETVTIDASNPMKVFVELGGDCNGVYVAKGATGFDVVELQGGASSAPFDYRVVAKRADFEEQRLEVCEEARDDPYLYPELREKQIRERERMKAAREEEARLEREHPETAGRLSPKG